jgi:hypothetical protein
VKVGAPVSVTITKVVEEEVGKEDERQEKLVVYFKELEQGLIASKTVITSLVELTGSDDTDGWIGKKLELFHDPNVFFSSKRVGGLRLRAIN